MTTGTATERCLARAVAGMNEPAGTTLLARIRSVDHLHPDSTPPPGLVLDERTELMERPLVMSLALVTSNRGPLEDALEVFESNPPPLRALCRANDLLADDVVVLVLNRRSLPEIFRSLRLADLVPVFWRAPLVSAIPLPHLLGGLAGEDLSIARGGDVHHPEIDTEEPGGIGRFNVRGGLNGRVEPERSSLVDEIRLLDGRDRREVVRFDVPEFDPTSESRCSPGSVR